MVTTEYGTQSLTPEAIWSKEEDEKSHGNSCSLNAIFNGAYKNVFCLINTCTEVKEAW